MTDIELHERFCAVTGEPAFPCDCDGAKIVAEMRATISRLLGRAQAAETQLRHAEADAEQAIHYTEMERDEARAVARVLAHAYTRDSRPPQEDVDRALAYPVKP